MSEEVNIRRAAALETATLSDALDRLGIQSQCNGIAPRSPGFRMAGRARTILYGPAGDPPGSVGDYIDEIAAGEIVVLDNGGRTDATVWGDILTEVALNRGIAGTLIDGVCRDVALCRELSYPVFSKGHWMRTGKDRVQVVGADVPVTIGTVRVCPGDLIVGDADGVIVIPRAKEDAVLDAAEEIHQVESRIREDVRGGMRLEVARRSHGYHDLQSRRAS
ncbi:RraA family protein [Aurantiacibacter gilvus]|uniref:Putative 4-hydroxy-4-methyl-2-oxoglutarate aldolase n=1 Tax=Aurantiacibacter gilvus TaxID=3139141 RepID=A0ABU9IFJ1_9SPHN